MRLALIFMPVIAAFGQYGPCSVEGLVLQDGNAAPIARAKLLFRPTASMPRTMLGYFTEDSGRFRAVGLNPEQYSVTVTKAGFLPPLTPRGPRSGATLNLSGACQQTGLQYLLAPAAVLTGRLSAPGGHQLAAGARVEAQRRAWLNGRWQFRTVSTGGTDDEGNYRIGRLPAGQYVLRAYPAGPMTVTFRDPAGPTHYVAPAYFPGVYQVSGAQTVTVETGTEQGGFDFGPVLVPYFRVAGKVLSAEGQAAPSHCQVVLRPEAGEGGDMTGRYTPESGEFVFPEVTPGRYHLLAYAAEAVNPGTASQELEIGENEATGLMLQLEPPFSIRGQAVLQGGALPAGAVQVSLLPLSPKLASATPAMVEEDGSFTIPMVGRERYRVAVRTNQLNIYLKSVAMADKVLPNHIVDWTVAAPRRLQVLLGNDGGRLEGSITGSVQMMERLFVVLVTADLSKLAGSQPIVAQGSMDGRIRVTNVPPGDYLAYAFPIPLSGSSDPEMLADPGWVPYYKGQPTPVRIDPNSLARISLPLLPLP